MRHEPESVGRKPDCAESEIKHMQISADNAHILKIDLWFNVLFNKISWLSTEDNKHNKNQHSHIAQI